MTIKPFYKVFAALLMSLTMAGANAISVGFDSASYDGSSGQITAVVVYDFSDQALFGGGLDLTFDPAVLSLVSYTRSDPADRPGSDDPLSPIGSLTAPGFYESFGVGAGNPFGGGLNTPGIIGTFVFDVIAIATRNTSLVLSPNPDNVWVGFGTGVDVTNDLFTNPDSIISANVSTAPIPVPAAIWFMLSGVGALMGLRRRS